MDFGNQFEVEDRDYWRHVVSSLTETVTDMKVKDILSVLTQMKEFGQLNTAFISQAIQLIKEQVQVLTTPEIVIFTMIYTSSVVQSSVSRDVNFEEKLDFILSKHIE